MSNRHPAADLMLNRPFSFIAMLLAIKDFFLGLGFALGLAEIRHSILYQNYNALWMGGAGPVVGIVFILVSLFVMISVARNDNKHTRIGLAIQGSVWLFSIIMYIYGGAYILAIIFGISMSVIPIYISRWMKQPEAVARGH